MGSYEINFEMIIVKMFYETLSFECHYCAKQMELYILLCVKWLLEQSQAIHFSAS